MKKKEEKEEEQKIDDQENKARKKKPAKNKRVPLLVPVVSLACIIIDLIKSPSKWCFLANDCH